MKNFFQRKQDTQPPRSTTPANAYKVWLPPAEASRAGPGPNSWIPSTQSGARRGGETYRGSSRPDVSSVPTSSAYKYATVPNNTNFYYPNNPAQAAPLQSFPPQYYPPSLPHPPDRPDSRLGYIPYPYPNPQYPQSFAAPATSKRREAPSRNALDARGATVPTPEPATRPSSSTKQSEKDDRPRVPRQSSSSSVREQRREDTEVKKPKHKTRESSETRKRKDSVVESYADKYRDKNSRKESRRNGSKSRPVEEVDSSDSSIQRPSSSTGHRHRRLEEGKMMRPKQESMAFPTGSRPGLPMQPTAASSSSGKHTPQISRMPVYLPANRSQRPDEAHPGLSESDTDHGTINRGKSFLRGAVLSNSKQQTKSPPEFVANKKVKESKGLWPFSRSKSSQTLPHENVAPPSATKVTAKKTRADSTPSRFPPLPVDSVLLGRPDYRRNASDSTIGGHFEGSHAADRTRAPQDTRSRPPAPDIQSSRALFFATQASDPSSRPLATASQQAAVHALRGRSSSNENPPGPSLGVQHPPATTVASSSYRQSPVQAAGPLHAEALGSAVGPTPTPRPETPLRSDVKSTLPPIYAPTTVTRASEKSTTPKVAQLVAGFEARSSDLQTQPVVKPTTRRESTVPQFSAQQPSQTPGEPLASTHRPSAAYPVASQPPVGPKSHLPSDTYVRSLLESSSTQPRPAPYQPDVLKTQLRDILSDASRNEAKAHRGAASTPQAPDLQPNSTAKPPEWNPSSQLYPVAQPPVQVYSAGISPTPFKSTTKSERPLEPTHLIPATAGSSRRPDFTHSDSVDRTSSKGPSRSGDERDADRVHGRSSRSKNLKDPILVTKTPSKDSSRHTSSPAPVLLTHSTNQSRSSGEKQVQALKGPSPTGQPSSASRSGGYPESQVNGGRVPSSEGDRGSHRDHRTSSATHPVTSKPLSYGPLVMTSVPSSSRPSALPSPSDHQQPVPSSIRPPSRSSMAASGSAPISEPPSLLLAQPSTRPSGSSTNPRSVPRVPSEESILKTPSSLAPSLLPSASRTSLPASVSSEAQKKGIFRMFRSKAAQQDQTPAFEVWHPPATKATDRAPHSSSESVTNPTTPDRKSGSKSKVPPPITIPNPALRISDRKSPNSRVFTPFRYLTNKRNRRISTASMDAVDGTAPNTVMGSPTASMQSSQMPTQSPPQRDPRIATQDWRNQEESDVVARGKPRRMRPGVVFDVAEDPLEETKRSRPSRAKKTLPVETTDSSDA